MILTPVMQRYILHWGEMGARWGVNRSVAQIHGLLFLAGRPMNAEEIVETLVVARSNVSNSLKELLGWGLVKMVHLPGDRRDHFEARDDPFDMLMLIAEGRKRREIDPTLEVLGGCVVEAEADPNTPADVTARLKAMESFVGQLDGWYGQMRQVPRPVLLRLIGLGGRIVGLLGR